MNTKEKQECYEFIRYRGGEEALKSVNICEQGEVIARIPSSHDFALSYFHSFGLTKNYIIFLEQSLKFSLKDYDLIQSSYNWHLYLFLLAVFVSFTNQVN